MKEKNTDEKYLMRLAIMMPIVIAAAIWFGKEQKEKLKGTEAESMGEEKIIDIQRKVLLRLQKQLDEQVNQERYEEAIITRDKINLLIDLMKEES